MRILFLPGMYNTVSDTPARNEAAERLRLIDYSDYSMATVQQVSGFGPGILYRKQ